MRMHRIHERNVLRDELREEGHENVSGIAADIDRLRAARGDVVAQRRDVQQIIASGGKLKLAFRLIPTRGTIALPSESTWDGAKASGKVALLTDDESDVYAFLYLQEEWLKAEAEKMFAISAKKQVFERRFDPTFADTGTDGTPDLAAMSVDELKEYSTILDKNITQIDYMINFLSFFDKANRAVLDGAKSQEEIVRRIDAKGTTGNGLL